MRTNLLKLTGSFIFLLVLFSSCEKEKETVTVTNPIYNIRGNANGGQEAPNRVTTTASGNITGTYNKDNNTLTYTVNWTGLTGGNPTAAHFHGAADPGTAAGVLVTFTHFPATTSGTYSNTFVLSDAQETDFMNGLWYFNIHNTTYPGGEIRGQVFLTQ